MKEITFQDAQKIVNEINDKKGTRKTFAELYAMSENTLSRRLKSHGYVYNQATKKYDLTLPNTESKRVGKTGNKENRKQRKQEAEKEEIQKVRMLKKVTYEIDEDIHFELRMKAFKERRNVSELVEQAIKQYLNQ